MGDVVTIGIDDATRRKGYWLAYVLPVVMLLVGTAFGHVVSSLAAISAFDVHDAFDAIFGLAAFGLTMWWSTARLKRLDNKSSLHVNRGLNKGAFLKAWEDSGLPEGYDNLGKFKENA
ncbi:MAG: SoxR reducing system RseC family protein [Nitrospirae bacterium]|nr:SoxR reducing system RseC family protein [Nitrospirota bacterium]